MIPLRTSSEFQRRKFSLKPWNRTRRNSAWRATSRLLHAVLPHGDDEMEWASGSGESVRLFLRSAEERPSFDMAVPVVIQKNHLS